MMGQILARDRAGPILVSVASVLVANLIVAAFGLEGDAADPDPPGWFIGSVWVAIFACLGGAYAALVRAPGGTRGERRALVGLGLLCLAYPFYTAGFDLRAVSLAGTIVTFAFGLILALRFRHRSLLAAWLMVPLLAWLVFAALILT
jgi:benzodiazapine receptor